MSVPKVTPGFWVGVASRQAAAMVLARATRRLMSMPMSAAGTRPKLASAEKRLLMSGGLLNTRR